MVDAPDSQRGDDKSHHDRMTGECVRSFTRELSPFPAWSRSNDQAKKDRIGMNVLAIMDGTTRTGRAKG